MAQKDCLLYDGDNVALGVEGVRGINCPLGEDGQNDGG